MKRNYLFTLLLLLVALPLAAKTTLRSPDKSYELTFDQNKNSELCYSVKYRGETIIKESYLGFDVDGAAWCDGLSVLDVKTSSVDSSWKPVYGERAVIKDRYNQAIVELGAEGKRLNIVLRAYDEGVAFKYDFPQGQAPITITKERSSFAMPASTTAYHSILEETYRVIPLEELPKETGRPLTMLLKSKTWVSIGEANMIDFARGRFILDPANNSTLMVNLASKVPITAPYSTPWRLVMAAKEPIELINNNDIYLNLSDPCRIKDTSWIKPGKVFRTGLKHAEGIAGVDFAAARGLDYAHFDAGWYGPERADSSDARVEYHELDLKLKEVCDYAATKGIGILVYVNQKHLHRQLDEMLPIYKEWGIKGIKYGFVNVGSPKDTKWLHDAVAKCAEYEIMVDIHDAYRPTGVSRTYPNLLTQEGIRGNEQMPEAVDNVTLPFSRFLIGAGDYTPCYFSNRIKTTRGHQLAMPAVFYSPFTFLFWYDRPTAYRGEKELEFWANIPTVWDDSRAIAGYPGEFVTMARRTGEEWFVGTMTNGERTVSIDTSTFLDKDKVYNVSIYQDNPKLGTRTNIEIVRRKVKAGEKIPLSLLQSGGAALHFTPVK